MATNQSFPPGYAMWAGERGPLLVLVGEVLAGGAAWAPHVRLLTDRFRVVTITPVATACAAEGLPLPADWSLAYETDVLRRFLAEAGEDAYHLAGWSLGGAIALEVALAESRCVRSLTMVEPQVRWLLNALDLRDPNAAHLPDLLRATKGEVTEDTLRVFLASAGVDAAAMEAHQPRAWQRAMRNRRALAIVPIILASEGDVGRLATLQIPTLVSKGDASMVSDVTMCEELAKRLPNARLLTLPGAHAAHIEHLDAFMTAFLGLVDGAS